MHGGVLTLFGQLALTLSSTLTPILVLLRRVHSSVGTAAFIINADKASREFELAKYAVGSGTDLERSSHEQQRLEQEAGIAGGKPKRSAPVSTKEAVVEWAKENRWTAVGLSWAASMVGSGAYIAATPLTFAQKLVQVRLTVTPTVV